ncbi:MAG: PQQ-binding-like beta-propeller repeat protein [Lentisphaerae bacterium]|jgi:outer membrane protein assembly factor BamB|nr:PQQ-binding-like beta-propeller repeat protein [Lentisphaerota bacterium]MBT4820409.1 PQQ-binding-like beta-propeller repeat protein [Lentisphaerota bacterium]MBT5606527.1 PQQ-binding-like beta-propeller repeat protein [Lentisphaerota bacterium]MBT7055027.1 PQQ-binding-like beta-propeller repeat protein [Lentisphaerota bacterium]MBT7845339.1 PQQ-binding-like beta-propeller repeat protein [Lentisphaerota bacterium]
MVRDAQDMTWRYSGGRSGLLFLLLAGVALSALGQDSKPPSGTTDSDAWPSFRGPRAAGVAQGHRLPTVWDVETGKNVRWRVPVPGLGLSSPVVSGGRLFLTTAVAESGRSATLRTGLYGDIKPVDDEGVHGWRVLCLDAVSGEKLWERTAVRGVPKTRRHPKASHANATPATDGTHVVAFFGSEGLYCFDTAGMLLWHRDLGVLDSGFFRAPKAQWGFASSPVIHGRRLFVQCDVNGASFVAAFDVASGKELWRTSRDDVPTWSTPTIVSVEGAEQLVVNGFRCMGGYDIASGRRLWSMSGGGDIPVPTPIVAEGLIVLAGAHGRIAPIYALRLGVSGDIDPLKGGTSSEHMAWHHLRNGAYMQTPLAIDGYLYSCRDNGSLACYRLATGELVYRERLGSGGFTASPVAGDGKLYFTSEKGIVHTIPVGERFDRIGRSSLTEACLATPAIWRGTLFFRTRHHLVAVGNAVN